MSSPTPESGDLGDDPTPSQYRSSEHESAEMRKDSGAVTPLLASPKLRAEYLNRNNSLLSVPLAGPIRPIRPLSPDTLSNLSLEDYDAIRLVRRSQSTHEAEPLSQSPAVPARGIRGWLGRFWVRNKGLGYMLIAQVFGTLMNVTTRILEVEGNKGKGLHPFQILFARMGITFVLATAYMWWKKTPDFPLGKPQVRWLLVARGLGGFCGVFGMYYSLLYLPLADATVMTFLAPSLACWACSFLINEPFTRGEQIGTLVSLIGIVFIAKPTMLFDAFGSGANMPPASGNSDFAPGANGTMPAGADAGNYDDVTPMQRLQAVGIAMIGVLGSATAYTTIRWIGKRAHPLISVNYFAGWCFLVSIIMQSVLPGVGFLLPADLKEWGYLIFLGTCGFVMQFLLAAGLSYEKSSRATNIAYTQMLFALSFDKLVFGHSPDTMSIVGSSIILSSAIVVALQKSSNESQQPKDNSTDSISDEESRVGTTGDVEQSEDHERLPVQEVHLRTLR